MSTQNLKLEVTDLGDSIADMAANLNGLFAFYDAIWPVGSVLFTGDPNKYTFDPNTIVGMWTSTPITYQGGMMFTAWKRVD